MRKHGTFISCATLASIALLLSASISHAECFDFSTRENLRLRQPDTLYLESDSDIARSSGKISDNRYWAAAIADVEQPISIVLKDLIAHKSTKNSRISEMQIENVSRTPDSLHQKAKFVVKPFPLMTVKWTEDWLFSALKGSLRDPQQVLVSFEKTEGTDHIQHLCGNIEIKRKSDKMTRVYVQEEVQASQRSQQDTLNGVLGTISRLREASSDMASSK